MTSKALLAAFLLSSVAVVQATPHRDDISLISNNSQTIPLREQVQNSSVETLKSVEKIIQSEAPKKSSWFSWVGKAANYVYDTTVSGTTAVGGAIIGAHVGFHLTPLAFTAANAGYLTTLAFLPPAQVAAGLAGLYIGGYIGWHYAGPIVANTSKFLVKKTLEGTYNLGAYGVGKVQSYLADRAEKIAAHKKQTEEFLAGVRDAGATVKDVDFMHDEERNLLVDVNTVEITSKKELIGDVTDHSEIEKIGVKAKFTELQDNPEGFKKIKEEKRAKLRAIGLSDEGRVQQTREEIRQSQNNNKIDNMSNKEQDEQSSLFTNKNDKVERSAQKSFNWNDLFN